MLIFAQKVYMVYQFLIVINKISVLFCHCRVVIEKDTKVPCAAIFTVNKEDHTLGNMLRTYVLHSALLTVVFNTPQKVLLFGLFGSYCKYLMILAVIVTICCSVQPFCLMYLFACLKTEGFLKVTGSLVHCESGIILGMVKNGDIVTTDQCMKSCVTC